jgi:hypothetical protein
MKKLLMLFIMTVAFATTTAAQDKAADIKKLFELMKTDKMMDSMMENMIPMFQNTARRKISGDDEKEKFSQYSSFLTNETKELSKKILNEEMPKIYEKYFDQKDIKNLIKFYESATGQKMLEKTPEISKEMMDLMTTKYLPEFQQKMETKIEELKK